MFCLGRDLNRDTPLPPDPLKALRGAGSATSVCKILMSNNLEVKILRTKEFRTSRSGCLWAILLGYDRATGVSGTRSDVTLGCGKQSLRPLERRECYPNPVMMEASRLSPGFPPLHPPASFLLYGLPNTARRRYSSVRPDRRSLWSNRLRRRSPAARHQK
jgi:hypothetical protein